MAVLPTKHKTAKTRALGSPQEGLWVPEPDMGHCTVHLHWATRVGDSCCPCWPRICEPLQKPGESRLWVPELSEEGNCQAQGPRQEGVTVDMQGGMPRCRPCTPVPHSLRPVQIGLRPRFSRVVTRKARGSLLPHPRPPHPWLGWAGASRPGLLTLAPHRHAAQEGPEGAAGSPVLGELWTEWGPAGQVPRLRGPSLLGLHSVLEWGRHWAVRDFCPAAVTMTASFKGVWEVFLWV